jgi:hypothetical protein
MLECRSLDSEHRERINDDAPSNYTFQSLIANCD